MTSRTVGRVGSVGMPEWPEWPQTIDSYDDEIGYERARADAWEARCRLAVEALTKIMHDRNEYNISHWDEAQSAIAAIGPLPAKPEAEG